MEIIVLVAIILIFLAYKLGHKLGKKWWVVSLPFVLLAVIGLLFMNNLTNSGACDYSYENSMCRFGEAFKWIYGLAFTVAATGIGFLCTVAAFISHKIRR